MRKDVHKQFLVQDELNKVYIDKEEMRKTTPFQFECDCCQCVAQRYLLACLCCIGFLILAGMRCSMSVAVVAMTKSNEIINSNYINVSSMSSNSTINNTTIYNKSILNLPEFSWTPETIGMVDSSYFWGHILTQIPAGYLACRYPANRILGLSLGISAFLNLLLPVAAQVHVGLVMAVRITQGLLEGATYPACHGIWRHWAPPLERTKLVTISFSGVYAGAVLGMPISGIFAEHIGWSAGFYVVGVFGIIWAVVFWFFTFESPACNPYITREEFIYIKTSLGESPTQTTMSNKTPWLNFFTSMPVYAIMVASFCRSWTYFLLLISQPMYMTEVFHNNIAKSGMLAALPHLLMGIVVPIGGQIADNLRQKSLLTTTTVRKLFNCGGFGIEACVLLGVGAARDETTAIICLTLGVGLSGFAISGFSVNHLDIAPRYASILMGLSNSIGTVAAMLCPVVTELMTKKGTADQWQMVFILASAIHFSGIIFYGIFASGEQQLWAIPLSEGTLNLEKKGPTKSFSTYGAVKENSPVNKDRCKDIIQMKEKIRNYPLLNKTKTICEQNDTSKNLPVMYGHYSLDGPVYETREELVQVPSKDTYLTEDRDL